MLSRGPALPKGKSPDQYGAKVIDVGVGGAGDHLIPQRLEQAVGIIVFKEGHGVEAQLAGAVQAVGTDHRTRNLLHAVNPVRIGCKGSDAGRTAQRHCKRQQKFHIAAAAALTTHGNTGFAA